MVQEGLTVSVVPDGSPRLKAVKALWRENSTTLGFFPDGAFEEYARKGWILGVSSQSALEGYLIYRLSGVVVVIVHLCVGERFRGKGLARLLVEFLRAATPDCSGMRANCRADFAANAMWPSLNFVPRHQRPARERGRVLKTWWYDYGNPDLFSFGSRDVPIAALDANVFFDFQDVTDSASVESRGLLADWLEGIVQLALAPEIYNEIDRQLEPGDRADALRQVEAFVMLRPPATSLASWLERVDAMLPPVSSPSDESDRRQLAGSIAAGVRFFVTRDGLLLDQADRILEESGVRVLRPSELVGLSDEELNAAAYQPVRLAGVRMTLCRAKAGDVGELASRFLAHESGERKAGFLTSMRSAAAAPDKAHMLRVNDAAGDAVALIVLDLASTASALRVVHLRVKGTPSDSTLAEHLVWHIIRESARRKSTRVEIVDMHLSAQVKEVLARLHFVKNGAAFVKVNAYGFLPVAEMARLLDANDESESKSQEGGKDTPAAKRRQLLLESALWPCKASDGELPTFIVPIKPQWAMQLFDEPTSQEDLFGADPALLLRTENIYYRAARPRFPDGPARVLWYVSNGRVRRAQHLVGCSLVTSVWVGPAKRLYTRFRRLGAFGWKQVRNVAKGEAMSPILAFTFGHTELFKEPVPLASLRTLLRKSGLHGTTLQGPIRVPEELFAAVYGERAL